MGDYVITVRAGGSDSETVICVDMVGDTPRVVELAVRAGSGLSEPTLPAFDLNLLLRALVSPGVTTPAASSPAGTESAGKASPEASAPDSRSSRSAPGKRAARAKPRSSGVGRRWSEAPVPKGRVYRRMPDDVVEIFNQAGTVTAVAEHYGVPRHTAQGWIGRLRRRGDFTDPG